MDPNLGQVEALNGGESVHYVSHADRYDRQLAPFTEALLEQARIGASDTVLDIGCGCGPATLQAARSAKAALGVDISHPLRRYRSLAGPVAPRAPTPGTAGEMSQTATAGTSGSPLSDTPTAAAKFPRAEHWPARGLISL
jgi:hypothetical protein